MRLLPIAIATLVVASVGLAQGKEKDRSEPVAIAFDGTDLDRVIKLVSDELSIRILYDERILKRKVNLLSPVAVKRKDLLPLLTSILEMQGFTMVRSGPEEAEVWKVVPFNTPISNPSNKGNLPIVLLEHVDRLPDDESLATLLVMLRNVDARSAFIAAQGMVSDPRMVQAIETANAILLTDTAQNLRRIGGLMQAMDQPTPAEGKASLRVEVCLFDVREAALASLGIRVQGAKEGEPLGEADTGELWSKLVAEAGSAEVRLLHRWSGRILEGVPMRTAASGKTFHVRLSMVPALPKKAGRPTSGVPAPAEPARPDGPAEGDVALSIGLEVATTDEAGELKCEDQTTLAGKEGAWLLWSLQSAAQDGAIRLFFARAKR